MLREGNKGFKGRAAKVLKKRHQKFQRKGNKGQATLAAEVRNRKGAEFQRAFDLVPYMIRDQIMQSPDQVLAPLTAVCL